MRMIRVLLVDDQRVFVEGLKFVLEARASDMKVVGLAMNGREAISLAESTRPDIVLMDVRMPVMNGVDAAEVIARRLPDTRIVMFTTFDDDEYVKAAMKHGAIGYLLKNRPPVELINSLRAVKDGIIQIDPMVARKLLHTDRPQDDESARIVDGIRTLTGREREVLHLIAQALDNRQIAEHLNVTEQTARNYVSNIYTKLGTTHRMEIMKILNEIDF
ncbi:MAG: DNA-binding response regulator [Spirochaetaceae bacterium]|nr:MAG: DNA-binding response regulator [Spirochaetaceae bacterium]